ncbi:MAG: hypothetical protein K2X93_23765 [Candidatus Obscuribacterales bacterium]|nr:hypothetical protein [Candidatus Obscuribacterales bacterium]
MGLDQTPPLSGQELQPSEMFHESSYTQQSDILKLQKIGQSIVAGAMENFAAPDMLLGPFTIPNPDEVKMSEAIDAIVNLGAPLPSGNMFEKAKAIAERMGRMTKSMSEVAKAKSEAEMEKLDGMSARSDQIQKMEADNGGLRITQTKDGYEVNVFSVDKEARTATLYTLKFDKVGKITDSGKYTDDGENRGSHKCTPSEVFKVLEKLRLAKPPA